MANSSPPYNAIWIGENVNADWSNIADWTSNGSGPLGYVPNADSVVNISNGTVSYDTTHAYPVKPYTHYI